MAPKKPSRQTKSSRKPAGKPAGKSSNQRPRAFAKPGQKAAPKSGKRSAAARPPAAHKGPATGAKSAGRPRAAFGKTPDRRSAAPSTGAAGPKRTSGSRAAAAPPTDWRPRGGTFKKPSRRTGASGRNNPRPAPVTRPPKPLVEPALGPDSARPLALAAVEAALDKQGEQPVLLDVRRLSSYADYVLVVSADNQRQLEAISRAIEELVEARGGRLRSLEAAGESNWLLMDFGDLVVHLFFRDARGFYDLEGLWADAPRIALAARGAVGPPAAR